MQITSWRSEKEQRRTALNAEVVAAVTQLPLEGSVHQKSATKHEHRTAEDAALLTLKALSKAAWDLTFRRCSDRR